MPYLSVSGLPAGQTVYIRLWRETGADGTFQLCARTTVPPPGCNYVLRMTDSAGDGWNGSYVTITINGVPTNYTINSATGTITFGAAIGQNVVVSYTAVGGFQNQNAFQVLTPIGGLIYGSPTPPVTGVVAAFTVDAVCNVPPAPPSDCIGGFQICNSQTFNGNPTNSGGVVDVTIANRGCLSTEHQGLWFRFTAQTTGTLAFAIQPTAAFYTDYDWAVWGPFAGAVTCPPPTTPLRCSWAAAGGGNNTGTNFSSVDLTEGAGGDGWIRWIDVTAGSSYLLYVDNFASNGVAFDFVWNPGNTASIDCLLPVEFLSLEAIAKARQVDLHWLTASESNSDYFQVERSSDGAHFEPLGRVEAAGFSQALREYTFIDPAPVKGVNYYRLEQVDTDGQRKYSNMVSATYHWSNVPLTVYPNPANESVWAAFEMPTEGSVRWRIMDASGRIVQDGPAKTVLGMNQVEIPLYRVEAGSYLLELIDGTGLTLSNARFVKQ